MPKFGVNIRTLFFLGVMTVAWFIVFLADVAFRRSGDVAIPWVMLSRDVLILASFASFYGFVKIHWKREQAPSRKLGFAMVLGLGIGVASGMYFIIGPSGFDAKNAALIPLGFDSLIWANIYAIGIGAVSIIVMMILRDIIFSRRRKGTRRNFIGLLILMLAASLSTMTRRPLESDTMTWILTGVTILGMVVNSFRLTWIVFLSKREKIYNLIYGFILFGVFIALDIVAAKGGGLGQAFLFYSTPLQSFIWLTSLFATIYFGMTFVSTLFHLPTAEAYDRKRSEVSSLHNLSRLITQVFDFNELVETVTSTTLEVCEASSSWLEIVNRADERSGLLRQAARPDEAFTVVAVQNITTADIAAIMDGGGTAIREHVLTGKHAAVFHRGGADGRVKEIPDDVARKIASMAVVPLVSHEEVIGILYATKSMEYGFDQDDIEVISTFADQATVAIENSRLIGKSLERERLMREMMLAQEMQRKLLPQSLPALPQLELEALSSPAFEVGGDYYDFTLLDDHHLAVLVGDVSGKGISAAFYMAEMKGIFQSISRIYHEPREFLARAHEALIGSIDRRSFISLVYGVLDLRTGVMTVARAGHCPLLHVSGGRATYIKPKGLGLGMGSNEFFGRTISQEEIRLKPGDLAVLYTDGVTEARTPDGEEFGYEKLLSVVSTSDGRSAVQVRDAIIEAVDRHTNHLPPDDDLTIVVLKWIQKH